MYRKNVMKAKASILLFTCSSVSSSGRPAVAKVLFYLGKELKKESIGRCRY